MQIAKVQFNNDYGLSKEYAYLTSLKDLKQGDLVVVEVKEFYAVGIFSKYSHESDKATKFIVSKLDVDNLEEQKEKAVQLAEIQEAIDNRVKEVERQKHLDELAAQDSELNNLIEKLRKLEK